VRNSSRFPRRRESGARRALPRTRPSRSRPGHSRLTAQRRHERLHTHCTLSRRKSSRTRKRDVQRFCRKPSSGLEPETPSLTIAGVTRVHARSLATRFFLQIGPSDASRMRREASRVSFLMCPFCVRDVLPNSTTLSGLGVPIRSVPSPRLRLAAIRPASVRHRTSRPSSGTGLP
jgi:hypothetical protein